MNTKLSTLACFAAFLFISGMVNAQRKPAKAFPVKQLTAYEKTEFASEGCRIINLPIPEYVNPTIYTFSEGGYVAGTNGYGDKQKANYFDLTGKKYGYIQKVKLYFGIANSNRSASLQENLYVRIYDADIDGNPGNELAAKQLKFSRIATNTAAEGLVNVIFDSPVAIPASQKFFVSIDFSNLEWSASTRDSLSLVTTTDGDVTPGQGWEQWSDDTWYSMYDVYGELDIVLGIFPGVSETATGCSSEITNTFENNSLDTAMISKQVPVLASIKFANPFNGALKIQLNLTSSQTVSAKVYDTQGRLTAMEKPALFSAASNSIVLNSTANLRSGIYILKLNVGSEEHSFKIVKQ